MPTSPSPLGRRAVGAKHSRDDLSACGNACARTLRPYSVVLLVCLSLLPVRAGAVTEEELGPAIRAAFGVPALENGLTAVLVQSLRDGRTLYATNPTVALVPASNTKLITAAVALDRLGPSYRFRTLLAMRGKVSRGTLEGDLILQGFGDPTLTTASLHDFLKAVRARGIQRIEGDLLVDDTYFDAPRWGRGWSWDYLQDYYAMEISALSLNNNTVALLVKPSTEVGRPALLSWAPPIRYVEVLNETTTGDLGSLETIRFEREPGRNRVVVRGSIGLGAQPTDLDGITVEDPALYCGHVLAELLQEAGIMVEGRIRHGALPETGTTVVHQRQSAPFSEVLPLFLKPSNNHFGEQIIHTVVAEERARARQAGKPAAGVPEPSVESVVEEFARKAGADPRAVRIVDGSGLSRLNMVTAQTLVLMLRHARKQPYGNLLFEALPIAANDGTLTRRMRDTRAAENVRAKTGTLNAVSCLSGFVTTAGGEPLVFSVLMNNFLGSPLHARTAQDKIGVLLSELTK